MSETTKTVPDAATRAVLITALFVAAFAFARLVVGAFVSFVTTIAYGYGYTGMIGSGLALQLITVLLPLAAGVFVGFRLVAPITAPLSLRSVLLRSLVASGIAAVFAFIVELFVILATSVTDNIFGNSFPLGQVGGAFGQAISQLTSVLAGFLENVPLVGLAAVLLWLWLRRHGATQGGLPTSTP